MTARLVAAILGLALVLGAVSLGARGGSYTFDAAPAATTAPTTTVVLPTPSTDAEAEAARIAQENRELGAIPLLQIATVLYVTVVVVLLGVGAWFLIGYLRDGGRRRWGRIDPQVYPAPAPAPAPAIASAVEQALVMTEQGEAREAVIACWLLLGRAAAVAGSPARPAETAGEFAVRLAGEQMLSESALARLADLYREARFSRHPVTDDLRRSARRALGVLQSELGSGVRL